MSPSQRNHRSTKAAAAALLIVAAATSTPTVAVNQSPLQIALTRTSQGQIYRYDVDYKTDELVSRFSVDPTQPSGLRIDVSSPPQSEWTADFAIELSEMDAEADSRIWCSDFSENIPLNVTPISQTDTTITYEFVPVATDEDDAKIMPNLIGLVTVTKIDPAIVEYRMYAPQSFKPMWLARIDNFDLHAKCEQLADGRSHIASMTVDISGKAGFQPFSENESWTVSSMSPVQ